MDDRYEPKTREQLLGYVAEEFGEVLSAIGKLLRWGPDSVNPEIPREQVMYALEWAEQTAQKLGGDVSALRRCVELCRPGETNRQWLQRELIDARGAIDRMLQKIGPTDAVDNTEKIKKDLESYRNACNAVGLELQRGNMPKFTSTGYETLQVRVARLVDDHIASIERIGQLSAEMEAQRQEQAQLAEREKTYRELAARMEKLFKGSEEDKNNLLAEIRRLEALNRTATEVKDDDALATLTDNVRLQHRLDADRAAAEQTFNDNQALKADRRDLHKSLTHAVRLLTENVPTDKVFDWLMERGIIDPHLFDGCTSCPHTRRDHPFTTEIPGTHYTTTQRGRCTAHGCTCKGLTMAPTIEPDTQQKTEKTIREMLTDISRRLASIEKERVRPLT